MNAPARPYPWGLWLIGAFKFASGLGLVALGVGLFRNVDSDPGEVAEHVVATLKLDHDNHYIHSAIARVSNISPKQLRLLSIGTFLYALMYLIEGTGLLLRKVWGEYFTVLATGFFIPIEIYEVAQRLKPLRVGVLAINVLIVVYLIYQVWNRRRQEADAAKAGSATNPDASPLT